MKSLILFALVAVLFALQDVSGGELKRKRWRPKIRLDAERITELTAETSAALGEIRKQTDPSARDKKLFSYFISAVTASYNGEKENVREAKKELKEKLLLGLEKEMRAHFKTNLKRLVRKMQSCGNEEARDDLEFLIDNLKDETLNCGDNITATLDEQVKEFRAIGHRIDTVKIELRACVGDETSSHHLERRGVGTVLSSVLANELGGRGIGVAMDQINNLMYPRAPSCVPAEVLKEVAYMPQKLEKISEAIEEIVGDIWADTKQCIKGVVRAQPASEIAGLLEKCEEEEEEEED